MLTRRSWLVYGVLLAIWVVLIGWQAAEHVRVRRFARAGLRHRAEDISNTLALIMRSQRMIASSNRMETILTELVKQGEVHSIQLLNARGEELVSAGPRIELPEGAMAGNEYWDEKNRTLTLINPVNLPTNIIVGPNDFPSNRPPQVETNAPATAENTNTNTVSL